MAIFKLYRVLSFFDYRRLVLIGQTINSRNYFGDTARRLTNSFADVNRKRVFKKDNDPRHKSRLVKEFESANIDLLKRPLKSADPNPIKHSRKKAEKTTTLSSKLFGISNSKEFLLAESMPPRVK